MKLKLVVASMSMLGLISCPALAGHVKHKPMKKHHRHMMASEETQVTYKDMGALPTCPVVDSATTLFDILSHNVGRAKPTEDCHKLIAFAGGINFDGHWGNRNFGYMGLDTKRFSLNDAYLNIYGDLNDWTKAFVSLSYGNPIEENANTRKGRIYSSTSATNSSGQYSSTINNRLEAEQAFVRFYSPNPWPVFAQIGKQFQPFGRYMIHPISRTMTQVLSESLHTSAELGILSQMGIHAEVFAFDGSLRERSASTGVTTTAGRNSDVYGAELGFDRPSDQIGYGASVSYLSNMTGVNDVAYAVTAYNKAVTGLPTGGSFFRRVGAGSIDGYITNGPFSLVADYVRALKRFNNADLSDKTFRVDATTARKGAEPWAANVEAGYAFNAMGKDQKIYVGYQASGEAVNLFLPKSRVVAGYGVAMWKNTDLGVQVGHDRDYGTGVGGTGDSSGTIAVRGAVQFG